MSFKIQIGSIEAEYNFYQIRAPKAYDGFGTITISESGDDRWVAIQVQHEEWQTMRYASGNYKTEKLERAIVENTAQQTLYKRLFGQDGDN